MRDTGVTQALGVGAPVPGSGHWLARLLALRAQRAGVLRGEEEEGGRGRRGGLRGERMGEARRRGVWNGKARPAAGAGAGGRGPGDCRGRAISAVRGAYGVLAARGRGRTKRGDVGVCRPGAGANEAP